MSNDIFRLPADWSKDLGITVLDADGWRADGTPWGFRITEEEFRQRAAMSTVREVATPAPLDPAAVKPGDTVTLSLEGSHVTDVVAAWERNPASDHYRAYLTHDPDPFDAKPFRLVGNTAYSLTDHQPAPEPEPALPTAVGSVVLVRGMGGNRIALQLRPDTRRRAAWLHALGNPWVAPIVRDHLIEVLFDAGEATS